jgi:RNA exonuclease 4
MPQYLALDVECAATGRGHNDRAPCHVALVNQDGVVLLNETIFVPSVFHPLTQYSGMTTEQIEKGIPLSVAVARLRTLCCPDTVLVGQSVGSDIGWMQLRQGVDYTQCHVSLENRHCPQPHCGSGRDVPHVE